MTQHEDREGQMEEQGEVEEVEEYDLSYEDEEEIGREMWQLRQVLQAADVPNGWVPPPSGLERYSCLPSAGGECEHLYMIGMHEDDEGTPSGYFMYTDLRGRDVLPLFRTASGLRAYVESQTGLNVDRTRPLGCRELGGPGAIEEAVSGSDLVVVDPDHVAHPGRCATAELGRAVKGDAEE